MAGASLHAVLGTAASMVERPDQIVSAPIGTSLMWRVLSRFAQRFPVSAAGNAAALSAVRIASSAGALRAAVHRDAYWREVAFGREWTSNESILVWLVSVFFNMAFRALAFDPR